MIRIANKWDKEDIMRMLTSYQNHSPLEFHKGTGPAHASKIVDAIFLGAGVIFVAEDSAGIHGMLLAIKNPNVWDPEKMAMHELAYWVDVNRRGTRSGYRLLKAYIEHAKMLKNQGKIEYYTVSKMANSPDLDYGRFGFNKLEEMWSA